MGFDTDDTLLNTYPHLTCGRKMSRDLENWLKSRMIEIDRRLSELSRRLAIRRPKSSAK
jgi:hypothetical protein